MAGKSDYLEQRLIDWKRGRAFPPVPTTYIALLTSSRGPRSNLNGSPVTQGDTFTAVANDGKVHFYKVTSPGTVNLGGLQSDAYLKKDGTHTPVGYPGAADEVIIDGAAEVTEQDANLDNIDPTLARFEPIGNGYSRVKSCAGSGPNTSDDWTPAQWTEVMNTPYPVQSSGGSGISCNANIITFPPVLGGGWGFVWGFAEYDSLDNSGTNNLLYWGPLTTVQTVAPGNTVSFQKFQIKITEG